MPGDRNQSCRRFLGHLVAIAFGLVLVGCSSSGSSAGTSSPSTTKATSSSSGSTTSDTAPSKDETEVRRLVPAFYTTYFRLDSTTQDPNDPKLSELLTGDALAYYQGQLRNDKAKGRLAKLTSSTHLSTAVEQVMVTGDSATLTTCTGDGVQIVSSTTGEVVDGVNYAYRLNWTATKGPDGTWRLTSSKTVASYKDMLTCPAA